MMPVLQTGGLSHSEIPASTAICASTGLIAACHVLLRLREPRHPPCALSILPVVSPVPNIFPAQPHPAQGIGGRGMPKGKEGQYTSGFLIFALLLTFQLVSTCQ